MYTIQKGLIHTLFEARAEARPQQIAVETAHHQITYAELNTAANRLAHGLRQLALQNEQVVGVFASAGVPSIVSLLAIFKAGGVYMPLSLSFAAKRLRQMLDHTQPAFLIVTASELPQVQQLLRETATTVRYLLVMHHTGEWETWLLTDGTMQPIASAEAADWRQNPGIAIQGTDSNYIFYTSGSTGEAKAILGKHESLAHFIDWEIREFGIDSTCRVSQLISPTFDASLRDILVPLCAGGTLCIPAESVKNNAGELIRWLDQSAVTLMHTVPSMLRLLTKELRAFPAERPLFPALKHLLLSGEALYGKDIVQWRELVGEHVELVNLYGPTETTMIKTFYRVGAITGDASAVLPVGKPMDQTLVAIINHNHICKVGEIGDVYIKTPYATKGYYKNEALTRTVFVQNPLVQDAEDIVYKTGDIGRLRPDKTIEILGRLDEQVKVNGVRVELNEIKQALLSMTGIEDALVTSRKNRDDQLELLAYYTGVPIDAAALRDRLKQELNEQVLPTYLLHLDEFPLNLNGKINKKALPQPEDKAPAEDAFEPVETKTEKRLSRIWQDLLATDRLSVGTSFFNVGGTSLKAIQLISRISREFEVRVGIKDVFANPSIRQLASIIDQAGKDAYDTIAPILEQPYYEVSQAQKRLWAMSLLETNQVAFNVVGAYELTGKLDLAAFEQALIVLIQRHESLRTTIITVDGEPKQKIHDAAFYGFSLAFQDLSEHGDGEQRARSLIDQEANTVFDLSRGPLIKAKLIKLTSSRFLFVLTLHHIVADGWSMEVIIHEFLSLYNSFKAGRPNPLPSLRIQYKDYAAWHNQKLSVPRQQQQRQYWLKRFESDIPALELMADFQRPAIRSYQGATTHFVIDDARCQKLHILCQQHDVTLFMALLALTNVLLYRYSGQTDIVVGTPVAGRDHKDLESQVGFYINMLPLRTQFKPDIPFRTLLQLVKETALEGFAHADYPFNELAETLQLGSDLSRTNLFDVVVQMQDAQLEGVKPQSFDSITVQEFRAAAQVSKYDLTFNCMQMEKHITVGLEYSTDLFSLATIEKMSNDFVALLDLVGASPDEPIKEIRKRLMNAWEGAQLADYAQYVSSELSEEF